MQRLLVIPSIYIGDDIGDVTSSDTIMTLTALRPANFHGGCHISFV